MRISFAGTLGGIVAVGLLIAALGAYPTWALSGADGLRGELAAAAIVLIGQIVSVVATVRAARRGPLAAAMTFMIAGLGVAAVSLAVGIAASALLDFHRLAILLWIVVFFFAMTLAESFSLHRALLGNTSRAGEKRGPAHE